MDHQKNLGHKEELFFREIFEVSGFLESKVLDGKNFEFIVSGCDSLVYRYFNNFSQSLKVIKIYPNLTQGEVLRYADLTNKAHGLFYGQNLGEISFSGEVWDYSIRINPIDPEIVGIDSGVFGLTSSYCPEPNMSLAFLDRSFVEQADILELGFQLTRDLESKLGENQEIFLMSLNLVLDIDETNQKLEFLVTDLSSNIKQGFGPCPVHMNLFTPTDMICHDHVSDTQQYFHNLHCQTLKCDRACQGFQRKPVEVQALPPRNGTEKFLKSLDVIATPVRKLTERLSKD